MAKQPVVRRTTKRAHVEVCQQRRSRSLPTRRLKRCRRRPTSLTPPRPLATIPSRRKLMCTGETDLVSACKARQNDHSNMSNSAACQMMIMGPSGLCSIRKPLTLIECHLFTFELCENKVTTDGFEDTDLVEIHGAGPARYLLDA